MEAENGDRTTGEHPRPFVTPPRRPAVTDLFLRLRDADDLCDTPTFPDDEARSRLPDNEAASGPSRRSVVPLCRGIPRRGHAWG